MKKFTITILASLLTFGSFAQTEPNYGSDKDKCLEKVSLYSGYLQQKAYKDAYKFWKEAVAVCPEYKPNLYSNGVYIVKKLSKDKTLSKERVKALKDSIAIIYEAGIKIFGATPDLMEDYGNDLIIYKKDYSNGVKNIKEALDGLREGTRYSTITYYSQALAKLIKKGEKDCEEGVKEFERLSEFTAANKGKKGYDKAQAAVEKYLGPCLTCDKLTPIVEKKKAEILEDAVKLEKYVKLLGDKECTKSEVYEEMAKKLAEVKSSATAFQGLAVLLYNKGKKTEALTYFDKAIEMEEDAAKKEDILNKAAQVALSAGKSSKATGYASDLLKLNPNSGEAYLIKASNAAKSSCGSSAFAKSTKYWVAYDLAAKAKSMDASVSARASKLMGSYRSRFPEKTELFAQGLKEGASYTHCSGAKTIVRAK